MVSSFTSRSQLLEATLSPGKCARPSSWRQSPGSHLGRRHPASFVTRWLGTRGRVRDVPLPTGKRDQLQAGVSLASGETCGSTRSPDIDTYPGIPSACSEPYWVPCNTQHCAGPRAPGSPRAPRRPLPLTACLAATRSVPSRSAPPPAAGSTKIPRAAPRSAALVRAHDSRPRPEAPALPRSVCSLGCARF